MIKFQELREKSVKGSGVVPRYLINPTPMEAFRFMKNTKDNSIRLHTHDGNLYAWDSWYCWHITFWRDELGIKKPSSLKYDDIELHSRGKIDPYDNEEGTSFGPIMMKNHKKFIISILNIIEKEYDGEWTKRSDYDNYTEYNFIENGK